MTHKSIDYKMSAVKYYLNNNDDIRKTCKIFDCKKSSLHRWVKRYKKTKNLTRKNREPVSYKITKQQVNKRWNTIKNDYDCAHLKIDGLFDGCILNFLSEDKCSGGK